MQSSQAVTPYNIQAGQTQPQQNQTTLTGTGGQFGTGNNSIGCTPVPQTSVGNCSALYGLAGQKYQANILGTDISKALTTVGQDIANAGSKGGGSSGIGGILGGIGSLFGAIFKEGGPVMGYANGGQPQYPNVLRGGHPFEDSDGAEYDQSGIQKDKGESEPKCTVEPSRRSATASPMTPPNVKDFAKGGVEEGGDAMHQAGLIQGYFTGAHHQQNYGGSPDTLHQAAQEVAQMLKQHLSQGKGPVHLAGGGCAASGNSNDQVMQALYNSLYANSQQGQQQVQSGQPQTVTQNDQMNQAPPPPPMPQQQQQGSMCQANKINSCYIEPQAQGQDALPVNPQQGFFDSLANAPGSNAPPMPGHARGGFMGYAQGGPPDPSQQPGAPPPPGGNEPLGPGQTFEGDGQVKGPGGPTDDAIPAKLSNGEFVMSAPATAFIGVDKLTKMNEQGKQGFMSAMNQVDANQPGAQAGPSAGGAPPSGAAMAPPGMNQGEPDADDMPMVQAAKGGFMGGAPMGKGSPMPSGQQNLPQMSRTMMKPAKNNAFMGL